MDNLKILSNSDLTLLVSIISLIVSILTLLIILLSPLIKYFFSYLKFKKINKSFYKDLLFQINFKKIKEIYKINKEKDVEIFLNERYNLLNETLNIMKNFTLSNKYSSSNFNILKIYIIVAQVVLEFRPHFKDELKNKEPNTSRSEFLFKDPKEKLTYLRDNYKSDKSIEEIFKELNSLNKK